MKGRPRLLFLYPLLVLGITAAASGQSLPEGASGIASRYPGDLGIASDPAVIFSDDFESYGSATNLTSKWNEAYHTANIRIATAPSSVFSGGKALEFTVPQQASEVSNNLVKYLNPKRDILFLRYYAKFDTGFNVLGSSHNGSTIQANYCCPGVPANGYNKFVVSYEAGRDDTSTLNPGKINIYLYHPEQRDVWGDHFFPTGVVVPFTSLPFDFGPGFVPRPDVIPELGRWYSYEIMVQLNTPGQRNGRIALWLDAKLIADFTNLRLRDTETLRLDKFTIDLHVHSNGLAVARKWYDNVVAATSYIGPLTSNPSSMPPATPTMLQVRP